MLTTILTFVIVLSLLVFVHELGHFVAAKRSGMKVEEFGFGFPPRIAGIKKGDTIYSVNWIPLGGFVKIKGESGEDDKDPDSFANKSAGRRALVLLAGVGMNIVLAWMLLSLGYLIGMPQVIEDLPAYARVEERKTQVFAVLEQSPAEEVGIEVGDTLMRVDGEPFVSIEEFSGYTSSRDGVPIVLMVDREGEEKTETVVPEMLEETGRPGIGIALVDTGMVSYPVWAAPIQGAQATASLTYQIVYAFGSLLGDFVTGRGVSVDVSGPVGIAVITAKVAESGFRRLVQFTAILSINLAVLNVLPIPALDGGRLLFLVLEKIRGRAVSRRIEIAAHNIGFSLLIFLVLIITYRDVVRFGGTIWQSIAAFFGA